MGRTSWAVGVALMAALALPASAAADHYVAGDPGSRDPFFPLAGNGGYDVGHYSLALGYAPGGRLSGHVAVFARATENLSRFDLDLRDFYTVSSVKVDGKRAAFSSQHGQELVIRPADKLRRGQLFVVTVDYAGTPEPVVDPDDAIEGWVPTPDGAFVVGEPQGAPGWFPVNDSLHDRATYDFAVTVPAGNVVMANGVLLGRDIAHGKTTWRWREDEPMVSYLATATNGRFQTRFERVRGLWRYDAVDPTSREFGEDPPGNPALGFQRLDPEPEIVHFFSGLYGDYAFSAVGGIIDWAPDVGYALETQTKPNYDSIPDAATVVHELSHQWWGDAVTIARWPDIWLNEGFATWSEWIYAERHGGPPAQERFDEDYAIDEDSEDGQDLWFPAPAALPGPEDLFGTPVYDRGAMTLQALRVKIGDRTFFRLLRDWYRDNRGRNVTTADFIALAQHESGRDLHKFFRAWLFKEGKPTSW